MRKDYAKKIRPSFGVIYQNFFCWNETAGTESKCFGNLQNVVKDFQKLMIGYLYGHSWGANQYL